MKLVLRLRIVVTAALVLVLQLLVATTPDAIVTSEKRIALVVGIGHYAFAPQLANPPNDASRMAEALRALNFEVDERIDPDYRTLSSALREFGIRAQKADAAVVFYAGHGVQVDHENYLIPADAKLERERDLLYEALPLELFLGEVSQAKKVGIVMLDACRNNPFGDRMTRSLSIAGRAVSTGQGLARVDKVPRNTVVAMATKADEIAEDGSGSDSPFTQAVLAHLQIPGLELSLFFRSVRDAVLKATNYRQEPYVFSSLGADPFYFNPLPPNRPPELAAIKPLEIADRAGPTPLGITRPTDPDNDPLTVRIAGVPRIGTIFSGGQAVERNEVLSLEKFMNLTYKSDGKTLGDAGRLEFSVEDGRGGKADGALRINVVSTNHPPVVEPARIVRIYPGALGIVPPTDPDGDSMDITITGVPGRGVLRNGAAVVKNGDHLKPQDLAALTYAPDPGAAGTAGALRYTVDDGRGGKGEGKLDIAVAPPDESKDLISSAQLWQRLREQGGREELDAFLTLFPDSRYGENARIRLSELIAGSGSTTAAPAQPVTVASADRQASDNSTPRRAAGDRVASTALPPPAVVVPLPRVETAMTVPRPGPTRPAGSAATFQDCPLCPVMVKLPGGSFTMGTASGDPAAAPAHGVTLRGFALGQFPVTVAEWRACVSEGGCASMPRMVKAVDRTPVHNLSWDDTQQYLAWLAKKTGKKYRLPSEAEWEYAARAATESRFWWGDDAGLALANCNDCGGDQDRLTPLPVDSFKPNGFGFYGVHGGVAEWVADCWFANYRGAPTDGSVRDQKSCQSRVLRGGSFRTDRNSITAASRNFYDASVRYLDHGFRVALTAE